jgi:hypothetical protein
MPATFNTKIEQMKRDSLAHGNFFFTRETMNFWGSKVVAGMFNNNTFVTSEDTFDRSQKLFTARQYDWEKHDVKTIGEFQQFKAIEDAVRFAKQYKGS